MAVARLAEVGVGDAEVAQGAALAASVADLAGDDRRLFVELNGLARLAEVGVGDAEVAQGVRPRRAGRRSRGR